MGGTFDDDRVTFGSDGARPGTIMRAHAHIPRARKTLSPRRASTGRARPRAAERITSYCAAIGADTVDGQAQHPTIPPFFLHRTLARSFWGAHPDQILCELALPVRALAVVLRACVVT